MEPQSTEENRIEKRGHGMLIAVGIAVLAIIAFGVFTFNQKGDQPGEQFPNNSAETSDEREGSMSDQGNESAATENTPSTSDDEPQGNDVRTPSISVTPHTAFLGFTKDFDIATEPVAEEFGEAVVGYEWEAIFPSPLLATIVLPEWDAATDSSYTVEVWNEDTSMYDVLGDFPSGEEIEFPREGFLGARKFKVLDIDPSLRICPGDRSFNWDAQFTFDGEHGLIRTPITESLPAGETCELR